MTVTASHPSTGAVAAVPAVATAERRLSLPELRALQGWSASFVARGRRLGAVARAWVGIGVLGVVTAVGLLGFTAVAMWVLDAVFGPAVEQATRPFGF